MIWYTINYLVYESKPNILQIVPRLESGNAPLPRKTKMNLLRIGKRVRTPGIARTKALWSHDQDADAHCGRSTRSEARTSGGQTSGRLIQSEGYDMESL